VTEVFEDVPANKWYVNAIQFVYDNDIMVGKGKKFDPNAPITREEFVQVLYSHMGKPTVIIPTNLPYPDVKSSGWYIKAVIWAKDNNIANGYGNGKFGVGDCISREQMAQMIYAYAKFRGLDVTVDGVVLDRFADPDEISSWAIPAIKWATSHGVINGTGDEIPRINPRGNATRAECAAMIKSFVEKVLGQRN